MKRENIETIIVSSEYMTEIVQLKEGDMKNPEYELTLKSRAGRRFVTIVLSRIGAFLKEMEIYRCEEPGSFRRRKPYTLEEAHNEICWDNHIGPGKRVRETLLCKCIMDHFSEGNI